MPHPQKQTPGCLSKQTLRLQWEHSFRSTVLDRILELTRGLLGSKPRALMSEHFIGSLCMSQNTLCFKWHVACTNCRPVSPMVVAQPSPGKRGCWLPKAFYNAHSWLKTPDWIDGVPGLSEKHRVGTEVTEHPVGTKVLLREMCLCVGSVQQKTWSEINKNKGEKNSTNRKMQTTFCEKEDTNVVQGSHFWVLQFEKQLALITDLNLTTILHFWTTTFHLWWKGQNSRVSWTLPLFFMKRFSFTFLVPTSEHGHPLKS